VTTMWPITTKRGISGSKIFFRGLIFCFFGFISSSSGSGVLIPGTVARVVKPDGSLAGYDESGELVVRSPSVALGYANNEQAYLFKLFLAYETLTR
jgi:4-coumarate--CoA ligase